MGAKEKARVISTTSRRQKAKARKEKERVRISLMNRPRRRAEERRVRRVKKIVTMSIQRAKAKGRRAKVRESSATSLGRCDFIMLVCASRQKEARRCVYQVGTVHV